MRTLFLRTIVFAALLLLTRASSMAGPMFYFFESQFGDRVLVIQQNAVSIPVTIPASAFETCISTVTCSSLGLTNNGTNDRLSFNYVQNGFNGSSAYFFNTGAFTTPGVHLTSNISLSGALFVGEFTSRYLYILSGPGNQASLAIQLPSPITTSLFLYQQSLGSCRVGAGGCADASFNANTQDGDGIRVDGRNFVTATSVFPRGAFSTPGVYQSLQPDTYLFVVENPEYAVPEPRTISLFAVGLGVCAGLARRRSRG